MIAHVQKFEQAECPVVHTFSKGQYLRELQLAAGNFIIGHKHKHKQLNIFLKGRVVVLTRDGWRVITAPAYFIGEPGRKIALVLEDMTWLNVHSTRCKTVEDVELELYDKSDVPDPEPIPPMDKMEDIIDYYDAIEDLGLTHDQVLQMVNLDNVVPIQGPCKFKLSDSPIQGKGIFATAEINIGEYIGPVRSVEKRTTLGRYTNHSKTPNAEFRSLGQSVHMYAIKPIKGCKGGTIGDEIVIDYRQAFKCAMECL